MSDSKILFSGQLLRSPPVQISRSWYIRGTFDKTDFETITTPQTQTSAYHKLLRLLRKLCNPNCYSIEVYYDWITGALAPNKNYQEEYAKLQKCILSTSIEPTSFRPVLHGWILTRDLKQENYK
jgi:hypothetical protein